MRFLKSLSLTLNSKLCASKLYAVKVSVKDFGGFGLYEGLLAILPRYTWQQRKQSGSADPLCLYYFSSALDIALAEAIFAV